MQVSYPYMCLQILFFFCLTFSAYAEQCNPADNKVLFQIKAQFNNSDDFRFFETWNSNNSKCCTDWAGVQCNAEGRVNSLEIIFSATPLVVLTIPPAIGNLPFLEILSIDILSGKLSGPIPKSFSKLVQLQRLNLDGNSLSGPVPAFLGRLTKLTYLDLASNHFSGSIPASLGRLTNLNYLGLSVNDLSGPIPNSLGQLKNLENLLLTQNRLSGPIPASLSNLAKAGQIDLSMNQLTGSIPGSFGSFNNRELLLTLSQNRLSGPIPSSLGNANFNILDFSGNQLSGSIPRSFGNANVSRLDLSMNMLTGDASFLFSKDKTALNGIRLNNNDLEFDISNVTFPIGSLREFNVASNKIFGSLPKQLGQLTLQVFNVSDNQLCGVIPTGRRLKRFSPDLFAHNKCLCGVPLPPCK